ncbi:hypothetical protein, partial [Salmonella enterica]|uniref:hypothetical protein n=1 Tax=Salmonella enterica TaxID=28901 RepID=UPI001CB85EE5
EHYSFLYFLATFLCWFLVNRLSLKEIPVLVPYAVPGIYPTIYCLTGACRESPINNSAAL